MKIININSLGGTCDRCGKGLVNVAVIEVNGRKATVGLDCLLKADDMTWENKQTVRYGVKNARELAKLKKAYPDLCNVIAWDVKNPDGESIWYYRLTPTSPKIWVGLACQNKTGLRKEIWDIVTKA